MNQHTIILTSDAARAKVAKWAAGCTKGTRVTFKGPRRSPAQSDRMWAMLGEIAAQIDWYGHKLSAEDFKDILTAGLKKYQIVHGIDGKSFVALGMRTSEFSKEEMSNFLELIACFGAERGVKFNDPTEGL